MNTTVWTAEDNIVKYMLVEVATDGGSPCLIRAGLMIEPPPKPTVPPTNPATSPMDRSGRMFSLVYFISD